MNKNKLILCVILILIIIVSVIITVSISTEDYSDIVNHNEKYYDYVESNILFDSVTIHSIDIESNNRLVVPSNYYEYAEVYQWLIYAIQTFDKSSQVYSVELPTDIVDETTNMVFDVKVYGEYNNLIIHLDMYNKNIRVEEE